MTKTLIEPRLTDDGVLFTIAAGFQERECLVSKNALGFLSRQRSDSSLSPLDTYFAFETRIHSVARRLVVAGESASPLALGAAYFVEPRP